MHLIGNESIVRLCASPEMEQRYGEPTPVGLKRLLLQWPDECAIDADSVFYDVGAGFGRLSAFFRIHTNASSVRGVELNRCRHRHALTLAESVRQERASAAVGDIDMLRGDVRQIGIADATHAFLAAQCFGEDLLVELFRMALAAPRLRCVVVLSRKLPVTWSDRVSELVASFGQAVAVNAVPTTYFGASAAFFQRGRCGGGSAAHGPPPPPPPRWGVQRGQRCWSMDEVRAEMDRQGQRIMT